jgi:DNA-binding CsgD family transcriptional regulator
MRRPWLDPPFGPCRYRQTLYCSVLRSNKELGSALGIVERTVKAHVAKLMRKVGVQNRIALSVHAITHSLVTAK